MAAQVDLLHIQDQKSTTTDGGGLTGGTDNIRDLNTVVTNEITDASLSSNQVTLPAGTYWIDATCMVHGPNSNRLIWYNTSDSADELIGLNYLADPATGHNSNRLLGRFVTTAEKVFELRHWVLTTVNTHGAGIAADDGEIEVYTDLHIEKLA